jgi:hypothetical protein
MLKKIALGTLITASVAFAGGNLLPNNELQLGLLAQAAQKKLVVLANMRLQGDTKEKFGNLYDEYQKSMAQLRLKKLKVIEEYAKNYTKLDDAAADKLLNDWFKIQKETISLKEKYIGAFKKILPASLVLRFYQIENRLDLLQEARVTSMLPLAIPEEAGKKLKTVMEAAQKNARKAKVPEAAKQ